MSKPGTSRAGPQPTVKTGIDPPDYDWQLRAVCANGELSTELMTDSQPTGNFAGLFSTVCRDPYGWRGGKLK
jgi:hypothetical protein